MDQFSVFIIAPSHSHVLIHCVPLQDAQLQLLAERKELQCQLDEAQKELSSVSELYTVVIASNARIVSRYTRVLVRARTCKH